MVRRVSVGDNVAVSPFVVADGRPFVSVVSGSCFMALDVPGVG